MKLSLNFCSVILGVWFVSISSKALVVRTTDYDAKLVKKCSLLGTPRFSWNKLNHNHRLQIQRPAEEYVFKKKAGLVFLQLKLVRVRGGVVHNLVIHGRRLQSWLANQNIKNYEVYHKLYMSFLCPFMSENVYRLGILKCPWISQNVIKCYIWNVSKCLNLWQ